jgi:hypothetical protein
MCDKERTIADMQATIRDMETVLNAADVLAAEHGALLTLVTGQVARLSEVAADIAHFQGVLAADGKHQLSILESTRSVVADVARTLRGAL